LRGKSHQQTTVARTGWPAASLLIVAVPSVSSPQLWQRGVHHAATSSRFIFYHSIGRHKCPPRRHLVLLSNHNTQRRRGADAETQKHLCSIRSQKRFGLAKKNKGIAAVNQPALQRPRSQEGEEAKKRIKPKKKS
jgi:hypothetical protein